MTHVRNEDPVCSTLVTDSRQTVDELLERETMGPSHCSLCSAYSPLAYALLVQLVFIPTSQSLKKRNMLESSFNLSLLSPSAAIRN